MVDRREISVLGGFEATTGSFSQPKRVEPDPNQFGEIKPMSSWKFHEKYGRIWELGSMLMKWASPLVDDIAYGPMF